MLSMGDGAGEDGHIVGEDEGIVDENDGLFDDDVDGVKVFFFGRNGLEGDEVGSDVGFFDAGLDECSNDGIDLGVVGEDS